jgi:hypothetical protein
VSTHVPAHIVLPAWHTHCPALQINPAPQAFVQLPQWLGLLVTSTHEPEQLTSFDGHWLTQCPPEHDSEFAHACAHVPQLRGSVCVLTHTPAQTMLPVGHLHCPVVQSMPGGHWWPQPPQLWRSVVTCTHLPAQRTVPRGHPQWCLPALCFLGRQTSPAGQQAP